MDNIQAMIEANDQLAARVQAEEQELYFIKEKSRLLVKMIAERKMFFIQKLFDKTCKHVNSFVPMASDDKEKGSEKKAGGSRKKTLARKRAVDWKTHVLSEDKMYYEIIRANGSTKSYKIFTEMLDDFDRQDVLDLYRLVKERFKTASPEGYDRLLWEDLITVFEPKKTYPLTQEMLSRMLSGKLEVDNECEMVFELLRFTRSQIEK
ncbi:hypothetical protein Tco_0965237 [Tanacetum coccineum]